MPGARVGWLSGEDARFNFDKCGMVSSPGSETIGVVSEGNATIVATAHAD